MTCGNTAIEVSKLALDLLHQLIPIRFLADFARARLLQLFDHRGVLRDCKPGQAGLEVLLDLRGEVVMAELGPRSEDDKSATVASVGEGSEVDRDPLRPFAPLLVRLCYDRDLMNVCQSRQGLSPASATTNQDAC
jgi:hypothetical protein